MGGKGGPLAFLNKKGWHPGSIQNQEKVWKREEEHTKEMKKADELRKQIAEEREKEEMRSIAEAAGVLQQSNRLDWMYQGGMVARQEADKRAEEALLGSREAQLKDEAAAGRVETVAALPSFYAEDTPASANEVWSRIHSDPLFAIRQQEQAARKAIMANPVQVDNIKKQVAAQVAAKMSVKEAKKAEKAEKKAKKRAKKEKKRLKRALETAKGGLKAQRDATPSSSDSDSDHQPPKRRRISPHPPANGHHMTHVDTRRAPDGHGHPTPRPPYENGHGRAFDARPPGRDRDAHAYASAQNGYGGPARRDREEDNGRQGRDVGRRRSPVSRRDDEHMGRGDGNRVNVHDNRRDRDGDSRRDRDRHADDGVRDHGPDRDGDNSRRDRDRHADDGVRDHGRDRERDSRRDRDRHADDSALVDRRDRGHDSRRDRDRHEGMGNGGRDRSRYEDRGQGLGPEGSRHRGSSPQPGRDRSTERGATGPSPEREGEGGRPAKKGGEGEPSRVKAHVIDGASAQGADLEYGLNFGGNAPEAVHKYDRSLAAEATRKRLEEAARVKEQEDRELAARRHQRKEYRPGQLSEEERQRRLAEMTGNAVVHDEQRVSRLKHAAAKDEREEQRDAVKAADQQHHSDTATFLAKATKEVYGAAGKGAALEDSVNRRKFFAERGGEAAFRR